MTRDDIVAEARSWIGTRFHHQASLKGAGCDCIGLVRGVAVATGYLDKDFEKSEDVLPFIGYPRTPSNGQLEDGCNKFMKRISMDSAGPGDIVLMRFETEPQHVAILSDLGGRLGIIHAYAQVRKVVEHGLDDVWRSRIVAAYQFRGVE